MRSTSAKPPSTCICARSGLPPMTGRRKPASAQPSGFALAAGFFAPAAFARPVVVGPPAAGMFVAVDEPAAAGRAAAALGFDPPNPDSPPRPDFGLSACPLAL